jgi:hypothetical protein
VEKEKLHDGQVILGLPGGEDVKICKNCKLLGICQNGQEEGDGWYPRPISVNESVMDLPR